MKKIKSKKKNKKNKTKLHNKISTAKIISFDGNLGAFSRFYPPREKRDEIIDIIEKVHVERRSSNEWWKLGEYKIFNALLDENEESLNQGIQALQSGADHQNPSSACLLDLAWILMFKNMDFLALSPLEKAYSLTPNSKDIISLLAICYIRNNNKEKGIYYLKETLKISPKSEREVQILKAFEESVDIENIKKNYCQLGKISPTDPDFIEMGNREKNQIGKFILKQQLKFEPNNYELIKNLGIFEYFLQQYESSKQHLEKYILFNPKDAEILTTLALINKKFLGDRKKEEEYYRKALDIDENHILALTNLSSLLQDTGLTGYHLARPLLNKVLSICPKDDENLPVILDLYGSNIGVIDKNYKVEAHFHLEAFKLNSKQPVYAINTLTSLLSMGDFNKAIQFCDQNKIILSNDERSRLILHIIDGLRPNIKKPIHFLSLYQEMSEYLEDFPDGGDIIFSYLKKSWFYKDFLKEELKGESNKIEIYNISKAYYNEMGLNVTNHNDHVFALEIWEEAIAEFSGQDKDDFLLNKAVCLSTLNRTEEAIKVVESLNLKKMDRGYTILGNIQMNAYRYEDAIISYKNAIKFNPKFILPISNAVNCCEILKRPELMDEFVSDIQTNWKSDIKAQFLNSEILLLKGRPLSALKNYQKYFFENDKLLDPVELHNKIDNPEKDLSLLGKPSIKDHKKYAHACILSSQFENFYDLFSLIQGFPEWMDGDWLVLKAEALRRKNKLEDAKIVLLDMPEQPPNLASLALCALEELDYENAQFYSEKIINFGENSSQYEHIEGNPESIAKAIISQSRARDGNIIKSLELAKEAYEIDVSCTIARTSYANACILNNDIEEAIKNLNEGLRHNLGSVPIIKLLIEIFIENNELERASILLNNNREVISENGYLGVAEKLGEVIALQKLKYYETEIDLDKLDLAWSKKLSDLSKEWLRAYMQIERKKLDLNEAKLFYLSKIIEKELGDKVFFPFKTYLKKPNDFISDKFQDFSNFLTGDYAPSLGGMHRIFRAFLKKQNEDDPELILKFRSFFLKKKIGLDKHFLQQLNSLSHLRNSLAHVGNPDTNKLNKMICSLINNNKPGVILSLILKI